MKKTGPLKKRSVREPGKEVCLSSSTSGLLLTSHYLLPTTHSRNGKVVGGRRQKIVKEKLETRYKMKDLPLGGYFSINTYCLLRVNSYITLPLSSPLEDRC